MSVMPVGLQGMLIFIIDEPVDCSIIPNISDAWKMTKTIKLEN